MNFATTIDIYSNPEANVIGPRAFSSKPQGTALLALAYFKGMSKSGIVCTAKHYPGHGQADKDSHGTLPVIQISFQELWKKELVPYRILIREGLPAIMSRHLVYPQILGDLTPSYRSPYFIEEVLRRKLGFEGVLVTDDLEMNGAIYGGLDTARASKECLDAGNDLILISHTPRVQEKTWDFLLKVLRRDPSFRKRIEESVRRILKLKLQAFKRDRAEAKQLNLPLEPVKDFFQESALRSVTLIKKESIPYIPEEGERILLIGQFEDYLTEGKKRYPQAETLYFHYSPFFFSLPEENLRIRRAAKDFDTLIFCLANYNSLEILKSLKSLNKKIIVVSALTPIYLRETPWVKSSLAVYGTDRKCFAAGFAVLRGDFTPEGKLPISLSSSLDDP